MALIDANYLTDASLIEKYMGTPASANDSALNKIAGVAEIFQSIGNGIYETVAGLWDPEHPIKSIINFTLTGVVTIFGPWWMGLIYFIASEFFNINFADVFEQIKNYLVKLLESKRGVSGDDVDKGVNSILGIGSAAFDHVTAEQTERIFKKMAQFHDQLRDEVIIHGSINKTAQGGAIAFLLKPLKLLVSPPVAKTFLGKVLKFLFKTLLIGMAKAKAGAVGRGLVGGTGPGGATAPGTAAKSSKIPHNLIANQSFGTPPEGGNWEEDFAVADTANQVANWAVSRYTQLGNVKNEMMQTESFKNVIKAITDNNSRNHYPNTTYIPHTILGETVNSKAELVDLFAGEIAKKVKQ